MADLSTDQGVGGRPANNRAVYLLDTTGMVIGWPSGPSTVDAPETGPFHLSAFYPPEDRATHLPTRDLRRAAHGELQMSAWRLRRNGARFWAHVMMTPIQDETKRALGFVLVLTEQNEPVRVAQPQSGLLPKKVRSAKAVGKAIFRLPV